MRKITIILMLLFLVQLSKSQTIELLNSENQVITNSTISIPSSFYIGVSNLTDNDMDVVCEITEFILPEGDMGISMCWGICAVLDDPEVISYPYIIGTSVAIPANTTNNTDAHFEYLSEVPAGYAKVVLKFYKFHDEANFVTLTFESGTGISELNLNNNISVFPNPAKNNATFSYNIDNYINTYIDIHNILGKQIDRVHLKNNEGEINFNLSKYNSGIYFYSLVIDNKIIVTKKLIIE